MTELNPGVDFQNCTNTAASDSKMQGEQSASPKSDDSLGDFLEKLQHILKVSLSQIAPQHLRKLKPYVGCDDRQIN